MFGSQQEHLPKRIWKLIHLSLSWHSAYLCTLSVVHFDIFAQAVQLKYNLLENWWNWKSIAIIGEKVCMKNKLACHFSQTLLSIQN